MSVHAHQPVSEPLRGNQPEPESPGLTYTDTCHHASILILRQLGLDVIKDKALKFPQPADVSHWSTDPKYAHTPRTITNDMVFPTGLDELRLTNRASSTVPRATSQDTPQAIPHIPELSFVTLKERADGQQRNVTRRTVFQLRVNARCEENRMRNRPDKGSWTIMDMNKIAEYDRKKKVQRQKELLQKKKEPHQQVPRRSRRRGFPPSPPPRRQLRLASPVRFSIPQSAGHPPERAGSSAQPQSKVEPQDRRICLTVPRPMVLRLTPQPQMQPPSLPAHPAHPPNRSMALCERKSNQVCPTEPAPVSPKVPSRRRKVPANPDAGRRAQVPSKEEAVPEVCEPIALRRSKRKRTEVYPIENATKRRKPR
ncbi:hypothetical protein PUNSTDRAFT_128967 [Punctularia strigosozonata HHB-11173 SS5]|uniref:uncharacterized protein n=1 Tax=Punctularia strigosozonata (strain HHB-11173) TaxID=741275 RepID=UPI0004417744|nr:uncharacterized protein PUNSTDRAFT_128967 [Punctularia strigosozonata HHB-11173 SS5]EIN13280.1 hypothetical protein PUNSTDRAFT_128967 [Punctularia strigosozonata HHB-11173 SS5]